MLVVVNPNNPTGLSLSPQRLLDWHARLAQRGGWLVVDEAFIDVTPDLSLASHADQVGLIVLRSFGKFFGLAGVRLGFVLAERKLLKLLAEQVGPWAVSGPTRVLGQVCLRDTDGHARQRSRCIAAGQRLFELLERRGLQPHGGCALFQWLITPTLNGCTSSWPSAASSCACLCTTAACAWACPTPRPTGCALTKPWPPTRTPHDHVDGAGHHLRRR